MRLNLLEVACSDCNEETSDLFAAVFREAPVQEFDLPSTSEQILELPVDPVSQRKSVRQLLCGGQNHARAVEVAGIDIDNSRVRIIGRQLDLQGVGKQLDVG